MECNSSSSQPQSPGAKRLRHADAKNKDVVIGLDVGGKLYYCRKSTLIGVSRPSYFAARFAGEMDPVVEYTDERGRDVFFLDRDPDLFKHILQYLRTNEMPSAIGGFANNSMLWRDLRKEAEFFALDGLSLLLKITFSCMPDIDGGRGILHWLGTNKFTDAYINPYTRGHVDVTGWFDDVTSDRDHNRRWRTNLEIFSPINRELFVQYSPFLPRFMNHVEKENDDEWALMDDTYGLLGCNRSNDRLPAVVDLRKVAVSPTHYSVRFGGCYGMQADWNFEGSFDGKEWVVLHPAREDFSLVGNRTELGEPHWIREAIQRAQGQTEKGKIWLDYMERFHRKYWKVDFHAGIFFRYFRIVGASESLEDTGCLHCIGLEIYGNVYEA